MTTPFARAVIAPMVALFMTALPLGAAEDPDFSGTWRLDEARSKVDIDASMIGLGGTTPTETLHISQPANGTLVVESSMRQSQARLYRPGHETSNRILLGEPGKLEMRSKWDEGALVLEGVRTFNSGGNVSRRVREVMKLRDAETLTVAVTISDGAGSHESVLVFVEAQTLGPCESWPTPCKKPGPPQN